jgi:hypothetical protein
MPDLDDTDVAAARDSGASSDAPSRRSLLRVAAGAGAAGLAASALGRAITPAAASGRTRTGAEHAGNAHVSDADLAVTDAIVVHVRDAAAGELDVFHGTSQVRLKDRDLVARIVRASR